VIHYRRTQVSWPTVVPTAGTAIVVGAALLWAQAQAALVLVVLGVAILLLLFATMTVIVDDSAVQARFGIGIVRKRVPLDRIRACRAVRNPWYYGWGIHFIPGGMLYNASGLGAIELQLTNGRVVRIGSDEPDALAAAVRRLGPAIADDTEPGPVQFAGLAIGLAIAVVAVGLAAWMIYVGMQPPTVKVTADSFSVRNGLYSNTVPFRQMTALSLDEYIPRVRGKTNGFALGDTLRGSFRVETWGSARLYVNVDHPPFVVVRSDDAFVAVNFVNPQQTRDVYAELRQALDRSR
jgi:hypothetical protein